MMSLLQLWASTGYLANYVTQTSIAHLPKDKLEVYARRILMKNQLMQVGTSSY